MLIQRGQTSSAPIEWDELIEASATSEMKIGVLGIGSTNPLSLDNSYCSYSPQSHSFRAKATLIPEATTYAEDVVVSYMDAYKRNVHIWSKASTGYGSPQIDCFCYWHAPTSKVIDTPDLASLAKKVRAYFAKRYVRESVTYGIIKSVEEQFETDIKKDKSITGEKEVNCKVMFVKTLSFIEQIEPTKLIFNFTGNDSLYFRFYKDDFRAHIEVFFVKEDDDDEIEAVVTGYKDDKVTVKKYGKLMDVFTKIQSAMGPASVNSNDSLVELNNDVFLSH